MAVEGCERGLQLDGQLERVESAGIAAPLLGHVGPDLLPENAELGRVAVGDVVGDRHARQLDDAALDGVHEGEVADGPGEKGTFAVAGAAQEEGRGGEVDDARNADFALDRFEAGDPDAGGLVVLPGLLPVLAGELALFVLVARFAAVAVVALVVHDEDILHVHQVGHDALEHLAFGLLCAQRAVAAAQQLPADLGELHAFAQHEGVVVGDNDLGLPDVGQHVGRHQLAAAVVAVRVVGLEDAQAVADGDAGRDDEEALGESLAAGPADRVHRLPGDDHSHDGGLTGAGGQFEGDAQQVGVGLLVGVFEALEDCPALRPHFGRDFSEPDERFDGLDLAEEGPVAAEAVGAPVLQEALCFRASRPNRWRWASCRQASTWPRIWLTEAETSYS